MCMYIFAYVYIDMDQNHWSILLTRIFTCQDVVTEFKGVLPGEYIANWRMKFLHNSYVDFVELLVHFEDWRGDFLLVPIRRVESEEMRRLAADVILPLLP